MYYNEAWRCDMNYVRSKDAQKRWARTCSFVTKSCRIKVSSIRARRNRMGVWQLIGICSLIENCYSDEGNTFAFGNVTTTNKNGIPECQAFLAFRWKCEDWFVIFLLLFWPGQKSIKVILFDLIHRSQHGCVNLGYTFLNSCVKRLPTRQFSFLM